MKKTKILLLSILSVMVIMSSCKKDDPVDINEAEVLIEYLEGNVNTNIATLPAYVTVPSAASTKAGASPILNDLMNTGDAYIIDVRKKADYDNGHIIGAVNVDIDPNATNRGSVIEHVANNQAEIGDKTIVIVCYSGQSAAFEAALVKLAGFSNVRSLLFGMCGWLDGIHGSWNNGVRNEYNNFVETAANAKGAEFSLPELTTGFDNGEDILMKRLMDVEAAGFGAIATSGDVTWTNKETYYVMNYWNPDHYALGHIPGAIMYDPTAATNPFTADGDLMTIPTDGTQSVVYCYTGQTSAWVATYLQVLGYNTKTMTFGVNGMWEANMPGTRWLAYKASHNLTGALHNDQ